LDGKPEATFRVHIDSYDICLYCEGIGQPEKLNLVSKFWLESGSNKFGERVKACVFNKVESYSFLEYSNMAELIVDDSITILFQD